MNTYVMSAYLNNRSENSPAFQETLTKFGSNILGRFGIPHPDRNNGIVVFVVHGEDSVIKKMKTELEAIHDIVIQDMQIMSDQ